MSTEPLVWVECGRPYMEVLASKWLQLSPISICTSVMAAGVRMLKNSCLTFRCYEVKIEESEKASSHRELNPGHLACAASALPLRHDNWTTTSPHNPLHVYVLWD